MLDSYGIKAERKSIYNDIEVLKTFGFDIESQKEKNTGYYLASRSFELPELKLLVDAVESSKFITHKKSLELIKKLEALTSSYDAAKLQRQVHVISRIKAMNESIYYNVDAINESISDNAQISFRYFEWNEKKEKIFRHSGRVYKVSPFALCWDDENYYLIAFDSLSNEIRHYRVDKMSEITPLGEKRIGLEAFEKIDMAVYTNRIFGMFSGREENVTLRCDNSLASVIIDRFGKDIHFHKCSDTKFEFTVNVAISPLFISWIIGFGKKMRVVSPQGVIEEVKNLALESISQYD